MARAQIFEAHDTTKLESESPRRTIGRYRIDRELGRGGAARVYAATDPSSGRSLAIKVLERDDPGVLALFEREYYTLASLRHPRLIEVWDFGITAEGQRYYTMEYLPGDDLSALAPLDFLKVCAYLRDVATTLALIHARRLVHRDVSPRNILIDATGRAKLLDFGALTNFGVPNEIVGTPMCIAPETIRGLPLDQRADLFSLGVVAYHALTGRKPFAIQRIADAADAYVSPAPPSELVPGIPRELDRLVLSMLSVDPMGRPAHAAEVIERFGAIAGLEDAPLDAMAEHHLRGTKLVGRDSEKAQLVDRLRHVERGRGSVVFIEGAAGMGRSRLADEALLEARLAGFISLRVEGLAHAESGGVLRALARGLLELAPAEAREALGPRLAVLGTAFPELRHGSEPKDPTRIASRDPAEHSLALQEAFVGWLTEVAKRRPLLVLVDDAHGVDALASGALAAIGHAANEGRILLLLTRLAGADTPTGILHLRRSASVIALEPLDVHAISELVASVFGEVPDRGRLSRWLRTTGHGAPGPSIELLRHLVDRKIIRYEGGTWVLPAELSERDLPSSFEEALATKLAQLSANALELGQLFALHRGALTLSVCSRLMPTIARTELYRALDELLARDVLVGAGDSYRLRQEALRGLLLERLDAPSTRTLHLRLARALVDVCEALHLRDGEPDLGAASPSGLALVLQAGFHFRRGGDDARGRELLRMASFELSYRGDGLVESVPVLEAALADYRAEGCSPYEAAYLMVPLTLAGAWSDFRLSFRYGDELLAILVEVSGLALAAKLGRFFGPRLALAVALPIAAVRYLVTKRRRIGRSFREVILAAIGCAAGVIGTCSTMLDRDRAQRALDTMRGLRGFPARHPARIVYDFQVALVHAIFGRYVEARELGERVLAKLLDPTTSATVSDDVRAQIVIGTHMLLGSLNSYRVDRSVDATYEVLDAMTTGAARRAAVGVRASEAAFRGEHREFERWQRELDVLAAQAGSTWRQDVVLPRNLWWNYVLCEDVLGLKRAVRQLDSIAREVPALRDTYDAARACYLAERGRAEAALAAYGPMFERLSEESTELAMRYVGAYAHVLRKAGKPDRARAVAGRALDRLEPARRGFVGAILGTELELALALAETGAYEDAFARLERLFDELGDHDNPLVHGLLHRTFAEVALRAGRSDVFRTRLAQATSWFQKTQSPALMAHLKHLSEEGRRAGVLDDVEEDTSRSTETDALRAALDACACDEDCMQLALDWTLERSGAESGYLYLVDGRSLRLAAPLAGRTPPRELPSMIEASLAGRTSPDSDIVSTSGSSPSLHRILPLTCRRGERVVAVGAVALMLGAEAPVTVDPAFLDSLARALFDLVGDVTE